MMNEQEAATPTIDLVSLIEQHAPVHLVHKASTDGGEYWSACPWCNGTDRFHVWPHSSSLPHYWCRSCGMRGDAIQFIRDYLDMSYFEACEELDIEPGESYHGTASPFPDSDAVPCAVWSQAAEDFIHAAEKMLWNTEYGVKYLEYLHSRGLKDEIIREKRIGCVPLAKNGRWIETPFVRWGLTEEMVSAEQWAKGCVLIPDGLMFPYFIDGKIWKIGMKRPFVTDGTMSRGQILGSKECLYNESEISQNKPVIITEAYLDAISIEQEAGDLVTAVSTDGVKSSRGARCQAKIQYSPFSLQSFDNDEPGHQGAYWWETSIANCVRWTPVYGKDANETLTSGHSLRAWVQEGLAHIDVIKGALTPGPAPIVVVEAVQEEDPEDPDAFCAICKQEVECFTDKGTPCCAKHFVGQQIIEIAMASYVVPSPQPVPEEHHTPLQRFARDVAQTPDPLEQFAMVVDHVAGMIGPCTIHRDPPGYTLKEHTRNLEKARDKAALDKQLAAIAKRRAYDYNRMSQIGSTSDFID
jgi:DNA primase